MKQQEILDKLKQIIRPYIQDEVAFTKIGPETDLVKDLKINSAHLVDIILDTEDAFNIEIDDDSAEKMLTVSAAIQIVTDKLTA